MPAATLPALGTLTDTELAECWRAGTVDLATLEAECARRDAATRSRAASRRRHAEWEAAAYAQYLAAEARCRGNMLSAAGKRAGRDAWPMLWQGGEQAARKLASEELVTFWDYESPRVPGPGAYSAARRAAERDARNLSATPAAPSARELAEMAAAAPRPAPSARDLAETAAAAPAGSIARYIAALGALGRQADTTARVLGDRAMVIPQ